MTKLVGILNITPDSFSGDGLSSDLSSALKHFDEMVNDGADIIDIGCQSTRPGAEIISAVEEWHRLEPFLQKIKDKKIPISIDSFHAEVIEKSLPYNITYINDVSGGSAEMARLAAEYHKKFIFMHSVTIPADKNKSLPENINIISYLSEWLLEKISFFTSLGLKKENLIFDPGIGFGKTIKQNLELIANIESFKKFGLEIYVGHSRKSFLSTFTDKPASERDSETALISNFLARKKVDYLRVHNIPLNKKAISLI